MSLTPEQTIMASRMESARRARTRRLDLTLVAFTIAAALVALLLVVDTPAQPSPMVPFFTTMAGSSSTC